MAVNPENVVVPTLDANVDWSGTEVVGEPCLIRWRPETVSILGITYRVKRKRLPDNEDGYIVPRKQRIVLGKHLSDEKAEQVLIHEVVHGILDQLGYMDLYEDERLVQGLAIGLHEAFMQG